jgi:hypothetical protein
MVTVVLAEAEPGQTFKAPEGPVPVVHDGAVEVVGGAGELGPVVVVGEVAAEGVLDAVVAGVGVLCDEPRGALEQPGAARAATSTAPRTRTAGLTMQPA